MKFHALSLSTLITLLIISSTYGMQSLGIIEKQILQNTIRSTGKENILRMHKITILVDPYAKDPFSQLVMQAINQRKQTASTLENHTQYSHQKDFFNKPYIELVSTFDKNSLLKMLNQE